MKRFFVFIFMALPLLAMAEGITFFEGNWNELLQKAKKENKIFFVDYYTTWCGPCKWMSKNTFTDSSVGKFVNNNFLAWKIDAEKGEGIELAKKYKINAYPSIVFYDASGNVIDKEIGASAPDKFLKVLGYYHKGIGGLTSFEKHYNNLNPKDYEQTMYFANKLLNNEKMDNAITVLNAYRTETKVEDEKNNINEFLKYVYSHSAKEKGRKKDEKSYKELRTKLITELDTIEIYYLDKDYASGAKDKQKIFEAMKNIVKYGEADANELNSFAWDLYKLNYQLDSALHWINKSIEMDKSYANLDTRAAVLFGMGRMEPAMKAAQAAIEVGEKEGEDVSSTKELIEKYSKKEEKKK